METLYHQTNLSLQEIHRNLGMVERAVSAADAQKLESEVQAQIDHVISNCERLDVLVMKEAPTRRANAKMRVSQLKYDCQHLQSSLRQLQHKRYVREQEDTERDALLSRTFTTNDAAHSQASVMIDPALQHHSRLTDSNRHMDDLLSHGGSILGSLRDQRVTLKGAQKRLLDIGNTLGMTNTVMRLIENRTSQDKTIMVALMFACLVFMYLVWRYFT